ncbi:chitin synthase III catalytic subunit [Cytidiella melzeri]|nr:chitin synthase III catalytic subunit [Cytidiella melzeri]
MTGFGDFETLCHTVPSYPWCNLFYRQLQRHNPDVLQGTSANPKIASVGINPECGIPFVAVQGSLANIANIIACGVSAIFIVYLVWATSRRKAAVGRVELRLFLVLYLLTLPLQVLTTGAFLEQGSTALTVLTAIHAGLVAATFWALLANGIVSTQVVEDGTLSSIIPFSFFIIAFFAATTYISLDVGLTITSAFGPSNPPESLHSIPLFVLTTIWPGAAALLYFGLMLYIVLGILNEVRPMWYYVLSAILFVLSQLDFFLLNKVICKGVSSHKIDGSFVATILETAAVGVLYLAWRSITEEEWNEPAYYQ